MSYRQTITFLDGRPAVEHTTAEAAIYEEHPFLVVRQPPNGPITRMTRYPLTSVASFDITSSPTDVPA